jgi:two-component system nitrogen regulation sensor histidine kinase NtrY
MIHGFLDEPDPILAARRRRREKIAVISVFCLVIFFGFLEGWFFKLQAHLPLSGNIFLFALINLNVILLLLLAYLVLRNIAKLVFERKRNIFGHKLKTQLVIAFVSLTLIPTIPLFYLATQFIFSSLDYWFSHRVEYALEQSVSLAKDYLEQQKADLRIDTEMLRTELLGYGDVRSLPETNPEISPQEFLKRHQVEAVFFINIDGNIGWRFVKPGEPKIKGRAARTVDWKGNDTSPKLVTLSQRTRAEALVTRALLPSADEAKPGLQGEIIIFRRLPLRITIGRAHV